MKETYWGIVCELLAGWGACFEQKRFRLCGKAVRCAGGERQNCGKKKKKKRDSGGGGGGGGIRRRKDG